MTNPRAWLSLARWLGPWASEGARPERVSQRAARVAARGDDERDFDVWIYEPVARPAVGAYLIAPGLHYAGPADPRMDRFCTILAASGMLVYAPFLPDYTALRVSPRAISDLDRAFGALLELPALPRSCRPGVFSISFGSLPALRLAASPERADQIGELVVFGGYADWTATIQFCLTGQIDGRPHGARDPLNQPVVLMNLLDYMDDPPDDPEPLLAAWREYVEATWGRPEMKVDRRFQQVALRIAPRVPERLRSLFLIGVGVERGALALCNAALARLDDAAAYLDPRPHLHGIRCPVHLLHGVDDDVIPYPQSQQLAAALPDHVDTRVYLTGLYGHTAQSGLGARVRELPTMARELWTMVRMLSAMVRAGTRR